MKNLYIIFPDDPPDEKTDWIKYRFSTELFHWFYDRLKYFSDDCIRFEKAIIDTALTFIDNKRNGCRIRFKDLSYVKFYEIFLLMEFTEEEWSAIEDMCYDLSEIKMSDVINYYYSKYEI